MRRMKSCRAGGCIGRRPLGAIVVVLLACSLHTVRAGEVFVSPAGSDSGDGTARNPYLTIQKGMDAALAGDTIFLRGGVYPQSTTIRTPRDGGEGMVIHLRAYPGETPILDFSSQPRATTSRGLVLSRKFWHVRGLHVRNAGDNGVFISGGNNVVEQCRLYGNQDTGLQISNGGSYNIVLNCDSYANYDSATHGENADGFAPKLDVGPGNVFRGCRAFDNADDGWDMYEAAYTVLLDSCWAFHNGYNQWQDPSFQGDGNGFKVGGNYVPAWHRVTRCLAFDHPSRGFDQNHNTAGVTVLQCTGWANGSDFSFPEAPGTGQDTLVNNLSYSGSVRIEANAFHSHNSWQIVAVTGADFLSLDPALTRMPRGEDGSLPVTDFLRPAPASDLVDAGIDVGLPFAGYAPDLGAFESDTLATGVDAGVESGGRVPSFVLLQNYPNPFNPGTTLRFVVPSSGHVTLDLYSAVGARLFRCFEGYAERGRAYDVWLDAGGLASGVYVSVLNGVGVREMRKLLVVR